MNDIYFSLDKHNRIQLLQLNLSSPFVSISHDIYILMIYLSIGYH